MTRLSDFIYYNSNIACKVLLTYLAISFPAFVVFVILLIPFSDRITYSEQTHIFTEADLEKYDSKPMVDQETVSRSEADLNSYITRRSAESLLEKEAVKREEIRRQQTEEVKRSVVNRKKVTVSQLPVTVPQKKVIATQSTGSVQRSTGRA